jgi:hypothetical protein
MPGNGLGLCDAGSEISSYSPVQVCDFLSFPTGVLEYTALKSSIFSP